jgi:hypothetical protein
MVSCPKCGHQNLPSSVNCSRCGIALQPAAPAPMPGAAPYQAPVPGAAPYPAPVPSATPYQPPPPAAFVDSAEEYARQMAAREAIRKRNRMIVGGVVLVVIGFVIWKQVQDRKHKATIQEKLNYAEKFVELEKRETGAFWNCVMASEVDIGMFQKGEQFQQRIESAYFTQQKTFADYLITECVPKIERARQAFGGLRDAPTELAPSRSTARRCPSCSRGWKATPRTSRSAARPRTRTSSFKSWAVLGT